MCALVVKSCVHKLQRRAYKQHVNNIHFREDIRKSEGQRMKRARMGYGPRSKLSIEKEHTTHTYSYTVGIVVLKAPLLYYIFAGDDCAFSPNDKGHISVTSHFHEIEVQLFSWPIIWFHSFSSWVVDMWIHLTMIQHICFAWRESFTLNMEILNNLLRFW